MFAHPLLARAGQLLDERLLNRAAGIVTALLVALLGYSLARTTWVILAPRPPLAAGASPPARSVTGAGPTDIQSYARRIVALHLFGEPQQVTVPTPSVAAPDTHLNLTLRGVVTNDDAALARAIIAAPGTEEQSYAIGNDIPGGAKLRQVLADRVLLERNGRFETLRLPKEDLSDIGGIETAPAPAAPSRAGEPMPLSALPPDAPLGAYRDALVANPEDLSQVGRAVAVSRGGRFQGFRIIPGRNKALLDRVGIQAGDIVTEVNGIHLDSPLKGLEVLQNLSSANEVTVTVLRNGQPQTLAVPLQ